MFLIKYFILCTSFSAFIPAPIVYGAVIDSTCLIWSSSGCNKGGAQGSGPCAYYDVRSLRHNYIGLEAGGKALATTFFALALIFLSRQVGV